MTEHVCADESANIECQSKAGVDVHECGVCGDCFETECDHEPVKPDRTYVNKSVVEHKRHVDLLHADVLEGLKILPSNSVHMVITSPPYWGVRKYGLGAFEIGAEDTFQEFLDRIVAIFQEVRRVLHPSGTIWVNMGDSYNSKRSQGFYGDQAAHGRIPHGHERLTIKDLHSKNLLGQPWQLAFALQKDGWILRDDIVWHKTNGQPSQAGDRTTKAHEYMFVLSKKGKYFFDWKAIEEPGACDTKKVMKTVEAALENHPLKSELLEALNAELDKRPEKSRKRSVWSIPTEPCREAHYSTFPSGLVRPCVQAGTSEMGCCPLCLAPVKRVLVKGAEYDHGGKRKRADAPGAEVSPNSVFNTGKTYEWETAGWEKTCSHDFDQAMPCTVLDIFMGSGTSGFVSANLKRNFIGIELSDESMAIAVSRITKNIEDQLGTEIDIGGVAGHE